MKRFLFIIFYIEFSLATFAQIERLRPETGYFSGFNPMNMYYPTVRKVLYDAFPPLPKVRIIVFPSFSAEYLITIYRKNGVDYLSYRIAKKQIWNFNNPTNDKIGYTESKINFDPIIADKLEILFFQAIRNAKFTSHDDTGVDGVGFIFQTYKGGYGVIGGEAWAVSTTTDHPGLIMLTDWLKNCALKGQVLDIDRMAGIIDDLIKQTNIK